MPQTYPSNILSIVNGACIDPVSAPLVMTRFGMTYSGTGGIRMVCGGAVEGLFDEFIRI